MRLSTIKSRVVGTPIERPAKQLRWLLSLRGLLRHPEAARLYMEDRYIARALAATIEDGWNCLDVGAHIGSVTSQIVQASPSGSHVAIEPTAAKAEQIRRRFPSVTVHEVAVSDFVGTVEFFEDLDQGALSGLNRSEDGSADLRGFEVQCTTLDALLPQDTIYEFMKIDVEGAELPALRGATGLIERCQPIILFECVGSAVSDRFGYTREDLFSFIDDLGYAVRSMEDYVFGRSPMGVAEFVRAGEYPFPGLNYIATPPHVTVERIMP